MTFIEFAKKYKNENLQKCRAIGLDIDTACMAEYLASIIAPKEAVKLYTEEINTENNKEKKQNVRRKKRTSSKK